MFFHKFFTEALEHVEKSFFSAFMYNQFNGPRTATGRTTADERFRI